MVLRNHGSLAIRYSLNPLSQGLEQDVEAWNYKDAKKACRYHPTKYCGTDRSYRRGSRAGSNNKRH